MRGIAKFAAAIAVISAPAFFAARAEALPFASGIEKGGLELVQTAHHRRWHRGGRGHHYGWYKPNRGKHKGWGKQRGR